MDYRDPNSALSNYLFTNFWNRRQDNDGAAPAAMRDESIASAKYCTVPLSRLRVFVIGRIFRIESEQNQHVGVRWKSVVVRLLRTE
jgi:hypothetical protein